MSGTEVDWDTEGHLGVFGAGGEEDGELLWCVGLELDAPVSTSANVDAGHEVAEEGNHLNGGEAQDDGELLLEDAHDLECLEQLDYAERLE